MKYLLFKTEYQQWWAADRDGYVSTAAQAGRYTAEEAIEIMCDSIPPGRTIVVRESDAADDKWPAKRNI
jgi:hypothetical protein